jgi:hypothetical protein
MLFSNALKELADGLLLSTATPARALLILSDDYRSEGRERSVRRDRLVTGHGIETGRGQRQ